jgi:hypothetical protein
MLTITDGKKEIQLNYEESIDLELKLNVSAYAKVLKHIGDLLYEYGSKLLGEKAEIEVETTEFKFLIRLIEKSTWEQCQGMK